MTSKFRTTVRIPKAIQKELQSAVINEGYGLRGKSKWVAEAISNFLSIANYHELVNIADEMTDLDVSEVIYLPEEFKELLDDALVFVRKSYPSLEGVRSSIIRASIIQRLIRQPS